MHSIWVWEELCQCWGLAHLPSRVVQEGAAARHQAGASTDLNVPPMGQRFRLKAGVDISAFSPTNQIILQALKTYGMLLADNGSDWFFSGSPDDRWDNDDLHDLQERILGNDFEAVDCSSLIGDPDSGQVA